MNLLRRLFKNKKKKVLVLWYPIGSNFGDFYIHETVKNNLDKWGYSWNSMDVGLPYNQIAKVAKKCDFVWFAGGGIIERGIPDIILQFKKFHKQARNIKYGITGLSIGEFDYSDNKSSLSYWINNASFFYTRDKYSADELNRIIGNQIAYASADVVFASDAEKQYINNKNDYDIGINFRDLPYPDLSGEFDWESWTNSISEINGKITGIPDQYDVSDMVNFNMEVAYSPQNALKAISKCNIVVAMRFHVILFAAKMGKIPIPINYCPKVERLAKQLGIDNLVLGVHDFHDLPAKINEVNNNKDFYQEVIAQNVCILENNINKTFDVVKSILKKEI